MILGLFSLATADGSLESYLVKRDHSIKIMAKYFVIITFSSLYNLLSFNQIGSLPFAKTNRSFI